MQYRITHVAPLCPTKHALSVLYPALMPEAAVPVLACVPLAETRPALPNGWLIGYYPGGTCSQFGDQAAGRVRACEGCRSLLRWRGRRGRRLGPLSARAPGALGRAFACGLVCWLAR